MNTSSSHQVPRNMAFCAPTQDDVQRTYELIVRCDVDDYGQPDTDLEDVQYDWSQIDLEQDAWLATAPSDKLVGYGSVVPWGPSLRYDVYVDPQREEQDLGRALLARCEARGTEIAQAQDRTLLAKTYVAHANQRLREIVIETGFTLVTHHYQMEILLNDQPPTPRWPKGVSLRTAVPTQDNRAIHQLVETAFARPGRTPTTLDEWQSFMLRTNLYDPDLWFLAISGLKIVGVCLSFAYPDTGWVRQLAVAKAWRRKGIGSALLTHAFALYHKRGYERVGLVVDVQNENALHFYQRIGLCPVRQHDEYSKTIRKDPR